MRDHIFIPLWYLWLHSNYYFVFMHWRSTLIRITQVQFSLPEWTCLIGPIRFWQIQKLQYRQLSTKMAGSSTFYTFLDNSNNKSDTHKIANAASGLKNWSCNIFYICAYYISVSLKKKNSNVTNSEKSNSELRWLICFIKTTFHISMSRRLATGKTMKK